MQDHPTANELIDAVAHFIGTELAPTLKDPRQKFRALVAANVLTIVSRELKLGDALMQAEWHRLNALMGEDAPGQDLRAEINVMTRALCVQIRAGDADAGAFHDAVMAHARQTVIEKLQIANPRFLAKQSAE